MVCIELRALKDGASWHLKDFQWHLGWPLSRWKIKVLKCLLSTCLRPWHHSPPSTAAADNCRFCFQSGNAWSVIARGGLQQSEKLIISYQIPLSLSTTNLLGSNDSAQLSTEILYACARCSARQQKWALHTIFCVNSFYKIAPCLPCLLVNNHYHQQNPFLHNGGIKFLQAK